MRAAERDEMDRYEHNEELFGPEVVADEKSQEVSIKKLQLLVDRLWGQRAEISKLNELLKQLESVKYDLEGQIQWILQESGLKRFDGSQCSITRVEKMSLKVPKGEAMEEFKRYLKETNNEYLLTVNSQSLNSWFNEERSLALGNGLDSVEIPGLEQPTPYYTLQVRAKKK